MTEVISGLLIIGIIYLLGCPAVLILYGRGWRQHCGATDQFLHGGCVFLGLAEAAHLAAVFLQLSVNLMSYLLAAFLAVGILISCFCGWRSRRHLQSVGVPESSSRKVPASADGKSDDVPGGLSGNGRVLCTVLLLLSVLLQIIVISRGSYRGGDMTLETVQTFMAENALYTHNPLTGQVYTVGVPLRLKILCLSGLYAALCSLTGAEVSLFVGVVIPVLVLLGAYGAYYRLGKTIFQKNRTAVILMLLIVSVLLWCGGYMVSMDGFQLLYCGYRGTAIRNGVLIPYVLSMCLEKKYKSVLLCILAEACIVWTLYGLGSCVAVTVIMCLLRWARSRKEEKR